MFSWLSAAGNDQSSIGMVRQDAENTIIVEEISVKIFAFWFCCQADIFWHNLSPSQTHVYDVIDDENNEEQHQQGRVTTTDSFYDLLQAVN